MKTNTMHSKNPKNPINSANAINAEIFGQNWSITTDALDNILYSLQSNDSDNNTVNTLGSASNLQGIGQAAGLEIIKITGVLWSFSYARIREQISAAVNNPEVKTILLQINSPGGLVAGCKELADFILASGKTKNIYAYADGLMASGAYWLGSAAGNIAAPVTAEIGSIGVRTLHVDWSKWNDKMGLKFTHIFAGEYKALGNEDQPLSKKAKDYIQSSIDDLYNIFLSSVSKNRKKSMEQTKAMANGKIFLATEAKQLGLIDRVEQDIQSYISYILKKEKIMDLTTLKNDHPDLYAEVLAQGKNLAKTENEAATAEAVKKELERAAGISAIVAGKEITDKIMTLVNSGATTDIVSTLVSTLTADPPKNGESGSIDADNSASNSTATAAADKTSREKILASLQQASSPTVNQQTGKETKNDDKSMEEQAKALADLANM